MKNLPSLPSALIRMALDDLRACEDDARYLVDMDYWHGPEYKEDVCRVCLAGAVLAKTFCAPYDAYIYSSKDLRRYSCGDKLLALDDFRAGQFCQGLKRLGYDMDQLPDELRLDARKCEYDPEGPNAFHAIMAGRADYLESLGL